MMDKYDGLALTIGALWFYIVSMPEDIYYAMNEQTLITRLILVLGYGAICLLYGIRGNHFPLALDFVSLVIALAFISSLWRTTLVSYIYTPSNSTWLDTVLVLGWWIIGTVSFYGVGGMITKSVRGLQGSAKT